MPSTKDRSKVWTDITDEELVEAVRFASAKRLDRLGDGTFAGPGAVEEALSQPTHEQWPDGGPHAIHGLGLIPKFGEGAPPRGAVTRRLKKLVAAGKLRAVRMQRPRGGPAPNAYEVVD